MNETKVVGIVLTIKGQRIELTPDEARGLRDELNAVLQPYLANPIPWTIPTVWPAPMQTIPATDTKPWQIHWTDGTQSPVDFAEVKCGG